MCLTSWYPAPQSIKAPVKAWKVLRRGTGGRTRGLRRVHWHAGASIRRKRWYKAKSMDHCYPAGFHVWKTRAGARAWRKVCGLTVGNLLVVRVRVRGVHTAGRQNGHEAVVASEEMIL